MQEISREVLEINREELFRWAQEPELLWYEENTLPALTRKPMLIQDRLCVQRTGTERHDDPHQTAHMSPTCPSASADPSVLGREPSSASHVEPTAGISGSSTSIGSVAGSLVEQAGHSRLVVAHTSVSSM
jgi:hypothetical protein